MGDSAFHNTKTLGVPFHSKRPVLFLRAWQVNKSNEVSRPGPDDFERGNTRIGV